MPEGWLKLQLHPVRAYGSRILHLEMHLPDDSQIESRTDFTADTDSTVLLRSLGGVPNKIVWNVFGVSPDLDTNGTLVTLPVPRFDTLQNVTLEY